MGAGPTPPVTWKIVVSPTAMKMMADIADRRLREKIKVRIDGLESDPETQGKPLTGDLSGYRSLRAAGQRYRIVYRVERKLVTVCAVALGLRREGSSADIYELAQKLIRTGLA